MHMYVCIPMVLDPSTMYDDPYEGMRSMLLEALPKVSLMRKQLATVPLGNGGRDGLESLAGSGFRCGDARRPAETPTPGSQAHHRAGSCRQEPASSVGTHGGLPTRPQWPGPATTWPEPFLTPWSRLPTLLEMDTP